MNIELEYGKTIIPCTIPDKNVCGILTMEHIPAHPDPEKYIHEQCVSPIAQKPLSELLKNKSPEKVVIIVSDITRPGPFALLLTTVLQEVLLQGIDKDSIHIQIANGTHRKMSESEMRYHYSDWVVDNFSICNHDCRAHDLVSLGTLESGNELRINKKVADADFLITIGVISPHYFAGFSGGRKSILPGVCAYETIRSNHSNIVHDYASLGNIDDNKIHLEMSEAAAKVGVDFTLQAILNDKKELVECFAGDLNEAFFKGVEYFKEKGSVKFTDLVDVVIVSSGGYPKDLDFYHAQKSLNATIDLIKPGGTIVLIAECRNNIEQEEMEKQLKGAASIDELLIVDKKKIQIGGHRAFATARLLKKANILILSEMAPDLVKSVHFTPVCSIEEALDFITQKEGENFTCYIVPDGGIFFPVKENKKDRHV